MLDFACTKKSDRIGRLRFSVKTLTILAPSRYKEINLIYPTDQHGASKTVKMELEK